MLGLFLIQTNIRAIENVATKIKYKYGNPDSCKFSAEIAEEKKICK